MIAVRVGIDALEFVSFFELNLYPVYTHTLLISNLMPFLSLYTYTLRFFKIVTQISTFSFVNDHSD